MILEGPEENVEPAKKLVIQHMANPWAALIQQAKREGRRGEQVVAPRCIEKDDGSKLPAPTEPLLVRCLLCLFGWRGVGLKGAAGGSMLR